MNYIDFIDNLPGPSEKTIAVFHETLQRHTSIQHISLRGIMSINDAMLRYLAAIKQVKSLYLGTVPELTQEDINLFHNKPVYITIHTY